ncbi:MAG: DUF2851 family protein [Niabella sp.]
MISEQLLQFIWQFQYYERVSLQTTTGEALQIISAGSHNTNQGPDFINAKIRIGHTLWAGSVELHVKASDWDRHKHQQDANYRNVILHVVYENDMTDNNIPVLVLEGRISGRLLGRYEQWMRNRAFIPCEDSIGKVPDLTLTLWKERLIVERLIRKAEVVKEYAAQTNYHWEEVFWWMLARSFGMKVNADAFEAIARSISVNTLAKHKHNLVQIESLLLGQAGMLNGTFEDAYPQMLQKEYLFLQKKYALPHVHQPVHFLRMRPGNFPSLRLAQLAALVQRSSHLFSKILEASDVQQVCQLLDVTANDFWHYHYRLDDSSVYREKRLGKTAIANICINAVVPVLFAYGSYKGQEAIKDKAISWLQQLDAEQNHITKGFASLGIKSASAWDSQSLLELKTQYCDLRKCLHCAVGNKILKESDVDG